MPRLPSAKRYAQAAFQIALERDRLEHWASDLESVGRILEDEALSAFLEAPGVPFKDKVQTIRGALSEADPLVQNLVCLLTSRRLVSLLPRIAQEYQRLLDGHMGRERGEVVTALPMQADEQEKVTRQLTDMVRKEVVLNARVEPAIGGGLIARVGDKVIDGSVRTRLRELGKYLKDSSR